jgi:hypothetical protein
VVTGRVVTPGDSGKTVAAAGAVVAVAGTPIGATTGSDGGFVITAAPAGPATLRVRLRGYRQAEQAVVIAAGDTVRVEIALLPDAQLLAPVRTVARPADLETFLAKPNVATLSISAEAMAGVPSVGEPDVVRVVQLLPGVVARNDFNTGLNVRGGEADQNLVLLDGHPIYNPFHLGGLFSTFMDATVGGIELMTGAFPARFGGRLSSVLDVRSAEETRPGLHGTADVSAIGATGRMASAFAGGDGNWSVAARRTYADAVTRLFTENVFPYHFRDVHGHAAYAFPGGVRAALTAYLGRDVLDANLAEFEGDSAPSRASEGAWAFNWGNDVVGLTLAKELGGGRTLEQRVSTSGFSTRLDVGDGAIVQRSRIRDVRFGGALSARGAAHDWSVGYDVATHRLRYASGSSQTGTTEFDLVQRPLTGAAWIEDLWRVSPRWLVQSGLRAEALSTRDWTALSPRLSVKFFATPTLAFTAAGGRVTQWLHSLAGDGALRYFDIWIASDSFAPTAAAWHWVAGAERRLGDAGTVRVEGYLKRYDRVLEANWSEDPGRRGDEFRQATGLTYGVDLLARWQRANGLGGWVAYSYGLSSRSSDTLRWAPGHDRRHDLDVVATWRVRKYRLGGRFGFATGTPYTPIVGEIARRTYDPSRDAWGTGNPRRYIESLGGARHSARFPPTHRLDLDASREFTVRGTTVSPYVSVVNAYNAHNVFVYLYEYSTNRPTRRAISQFPILPSLGVRVAF